MSDFNNEIINGDRFAFGENWSQFLEVLNEDRIRDAEISLKTMLGLNRLDGLTFLDAGCGSGLFSLAAQRLGAAVHSFDYDPQSVATTLEMRRRYCQNYDMWHVESGSILDINYLNNLGKFDIVYSWGVLHHTGYMWQSMDNITKLVADNGRLYIALYNNQGIISDIWTYIKKTYNKSSLQVRNLIGMSYHLLVLATRTTSGIRHVKPIKEWYKGSERGMSLWNDTVDWVGGYPFETSTPAATIEFYSKKEFRLLKLKEKKGSGCNEYVFERNHSPYY